MPAFPPELTIQPKHGLDAEITVPGSKSLTNRALIIAALADGRSELEGGLIAEDSDVMIRALNTLGIPVEVDGATFRVHGQNGRIPETRATLDLRLSGTSIRFLTALVALGHGHYQLDGNERMRERPIADLLNALTQLGVKAGTRFETGCPPVIVEAAGLPGGTTTLAGGSSSQYLSALLMAAPYASAPIRIQLAGELQSKPFVDMTLAIMEDFGVRAARQDYRHFEVQPGRYQARPYRIEGDAMAAGYFWAAAALAGGRAKIMNLGRNSRQGDRRLADVLQQMGCSVRWTEHSCEVTSPPDGRLRGGTFDLNDMPDQAQTLAVVALFAETPVRIENVWNLRIKETDRLSAMSTELRKLGADVVEEQDALLVRPLPADRAPASVSLETYGDHRMAMALALAGLKLPGVTIRDPACVNKTFPKYFEVLSAL
ncbi:MAG TPA: 3-phosphoshikimate 1-carboxyvinyltransferase [Trueperaceae bacterium]